MATIAQDDRSADRLLEYQAEPVTSGIAAMAVAFLTHSPELEPPSEMAAKVRATLIAAQQHFDFVEHCKMPCEPLPSLHLPAKNALQLSTNRSLAAIRIFRFT